MDELDLPTPDGLGIGSRTIDDDNTSDEDEDLDANDVEFDDEKVKEAVVDDDDDDKEEWEEKVDNHRHVRRYSTMAPHPNQMALAPGMASVPLKMHRHQKKARKRKIFG